MKTKEEIIKELTRNIWNKIISEPKNKIGYFNFSPSKLKKEIEETFSETNNGWTKIESESDLPKDNKKEYRFGTLIRNKFYLNKGVYKKDEVSQSWYSKEITHYQEIKQIPPPLH